MDSQSIAARMQPYLYIDTSGRDEDTLRVKSRDGVQGTVRLGEAPYESLLVDFDTGYRILVSFRDVTLPDGTEFTQEDLQLAFQTKHIEIYGACIIDVEYRNIPH